MQINQIQKSSFNCSPKRTILIINLIILIELRAGQRTWKWGMENVQINIQCNKDYDWNWSIDYLKPGQGERQGEREAAQRYKFVSLIIQLRIQLKLNTALLSTVRPCVRVSQAWHLTFLTYIKA